MCSGADQIEIVAIYFVNQQPIWLDMTVSKVLPFAAERVIFVPLRQRLALGELQGQLP